MSINKRIREALRTKGVEQKALAEYMGYKTQGSISNKLTGKDTDSIKLVLAVCNLTGSNPEWILRGTGQPFGKKTVAQQLEDEGIHWSSIEEDSETRIDRLEKQVDRLATLIKKLL